MNIKQAKNIAEHMYKKGESAYIGNYAIAATIGCKPKQITEAMEKKVLKEFWQLVVDGNKRPAIERLYAEKKLKEMKNG